MSMIRVSNLSFGYEGSYDMIFEDVSFQLDTNWRLGFTGRNGRGKTTFLRLLAGHFPYQGSIQASVEFDLFPFEVADPQRMVYEILEEISPFAELWEFQRELSLLEVDDNVLYRPFSTLSSGEKTKVLLAGLFLGDNRFLLIDEPTNHLDGHAREVLAAYLRNKKGFILVSHDRHFLDSCIDHILSINRTNIEVMRGNFSTWQANKAMQDAAELEENERLKKDIKRLEAAARQAERWSENVEKTKYSRSAGGSDLNRGFLDKGHIGHQAAKMMKRSKSIVNRAQNAAEEKSGLLKNIETAEDLRIHPLSYPKPLLAQLRDVSVYYGSHTAVENVSFSVRPGDRIALDGRNGAGKSTILKLLAGEPLIHTGEIQLGSQLVTSVVCQETAFLTGSLTEYAQKMGIDQSLFLAILRKLDFSRLQFEKDMSAFSGGQKKKVLLATSLCQPAHLYLWDEPLNFIDVLSRIQIENLLLEYTPTMVFVEHDRAFRERIATDIVTL